MIRDIEKLRTGSIKSRLAFLLRDSAFYGGLSAFASMASVFLVPLYTRMFTKAEFGSYDILSVVGMVVVPFLIMGQDSAIARHFYETEDQAERRALVSQSVVFQIALSLATSCVLFFSADLLVSHLFGQPSFAHYFRVIALSLPFVVLCRITRNLLKWTFQRQRFLVMTLVSVIVQFACILGYLLLIERSIVGIFVGQLLSYAVFALLGVWYCRDFLTLPRHWHYLGRLLNYGWPFMLIALVGALTPAVDRVFMVNVVSLETLALYALGKKLTSLLNLPLQGFQVAWGPFVFSIYQQADAAATYDRVLGLYTLFMTGVSLGVVLLADPLILVFGSGQYLGSRVVVLPLALAIVVDGISWITGVGINLSKKTYLTTIVYAISMSVTVAAVALLVPPFGMVGAAWGVLLGRVAQTGVKTYLARRVWPLRLSLGRVSLLLGVTALLSLAFQALPNLLWAQALGGMLAGVAFLGFTWFGFLDPAERAQVLAFGRKLRHL